MYKQYSILQIHHNSNFHHGNDTGPLASSALDDSCWKLPCCCDACCCCCADDDSTWICVNLDALKTCPGANGSNRGISEDDDDEEEGVEVRAAWPENITFKT